MTESLAASAAIAFWEFCCDRTVDLLDIVLHIELDAVPGADGPGARPQRKPKGPRLSYSQFQLLSHYEVLDVPIHAEEEDLKRAYRQKALEHHPDKNLDDPDAAKKFLRVKEAFETLKDPVLHAEYDYQRGKQQDIPRTAPTPARTPQGNEQTSLLDILGRFRNFVLYGGFLSSLTGPPLPPGIARLSPAQYIHQYPPPFKNTGISIDDLASFITSFPDVRLTMKPGPLNFFKVVGGFFDCIEYDELQHDRHTARAPIFGNELNRWCSRDNRPYSLDAYTIVPLRPPYAADFYEHWVQFETKKDFSWMAFHGYAPQDLVYASVRERAEAANIAGRLQYKAQYEAMVRSIASALMGIDPRLSRFYMTIGRPEPGNRPGPGPNRPEPGTSRKYDPNANHKNRRKGKKTKKGKARW